MTDKSIFKKYRLLPLVGVGLASLVLLVGLSLLLWTAIAFKGNFDLSQRATAPLLIYLGAIFLSCCLMTLLIRGGTVFPSALLGLAAGATALILAPAGAAPGQLILKLLISLAVALAGFTLTKLYFRQRRPRRPPKEAEPQERLIIWDEEIGGINEPGK